MNVSDVENKYTSGVDYNTKNIWIDGKNITDKALENNSLLEDKSKDTIYLNNWYLPNGRKRNDQKVLLRCGRNRSE